MTQLTHFYVTTRINNNMLCFGENIWHQSTNNSKIAEYILLPATRSSAYGLSPSMQNFSLDVFAKITST